MQPQQKSINQPELSSLSGAMLKCDVGVITAFVEINSSAENNEKMRQLQAFLLNIKYNVTRVLGSYVQDFSGDSNKSLIEYFFVADQMHAGRLKDDLIAAGTFFGQDSIVFKAVGNSAKLYGTLASADCVPGHGAVLDLGVAEDVVDAELFSKITGRAFSFESIHPVKMPGTINGIRAMTILSNSLGIASHIAHAEGT